VDWRFVEDERWAEIHQALNGAGTESMGTLWDEKFGEKALQAASEAAAKTKARGARAPRKAAPARGGVGSRKRKSPVKAKQTSKETEKIPDGQVKPDEPSKEPNNE
jgi:hypothetical protein